MGHGSIGFHILSVKMRALALGSTGPLEYCSLGVMGSGSNGPRE